MRLTAATLIASLAWTACSMAGPARPVHIELGKNFSLRPGESAQISDGDLRVGFEAVTADSRCPKGEQCVWAGDATVQVWLQQGFGPRATRQLHAAPGAAQAASALGHELRLVRLDPHPVSGKAVAKPDHVATLTLSRGSAAEAER